MLHITVNSLSDTHCPDQFFSYRKIPRVPVPLPSPSNSNCPPLPLSVPFISPIQPSTSPSSSPSPQNLPSLYPSRTYFPSILVFSVFSYLSPALLPPCVQCPSQLNPDSLRFDSMRSGSICNLISPRFPEVRRDF